MRYLVGIITLAVWLISASGVGAYYLDAPHNESNGIYCATCHNSPAFKAPQPVGDIDNTRRNAVCLQCHVASPSAAFIPFKAPVKKLHASSSITSGKFGQWTTECTQCHDVHYQGQLDWAGDPDIYLATGTVAANSQDYDTVSKSTTVDIGTPTANPPGSGWDNTANWDSKGGRIDPASAEDGTRGLIFVPDLNNPEAYEIISATPTSVTVKGKMTAALNAPYGVIYGQSIKSRLLPNGGSKVDDLRDVRFYRPEVVTNTWGGYVDETVGSTKPAGLCQVCHSAELMVWKKTGEAQTHHVGENCRTCHDAIKGFPPAKNHSLFIVDAPAPDGCSCHASKITNPDSGHVGGCSVCHTATKPEINTNVMTTEASGTVLSNLQSNGYTGGTANSRLKFGIYGISDDPDFPKINCGSCHLGKPGLVQSGDHGHTDSTFSWAGNCADCHSGVNIVRDIHDNVCTLCHVSASGGARKVGDASNGVDGHADGETTASTCLDCHDPDLGTIHHVSENGYAANGECTFCHATSGYQGNHTALVAGIPACTSCHTATAGTGTGVPVSSGDNQVHDACTTCHGTTGALLSKEAANVNGYILGLMAAGDCGMCHTAVYFENHVHGTTGGYTTHDVAYDAALDLAQVTPGTPCATCHTPTGGLAAWSGIVNEHGGCARCHGYTNIDGLNSPPLITNNITIASGAVVHCLTCHTEKITPVTHHIGGEVTGTGCQDCHGMDASAGGHGTTVSHATHTANDANHLKGPDITCDACHDTNNFPLFKSGADSNGDGKFTLAETDVCNTCHSPGGSYDGVNDPAVGAKVNWEIGIYGTDYVTLRSGKEKWCATCHDESPSVIGGISAPNVVGAEDANSTYGAGYGYYKTGHGLPANQDYPSSGGATAGAGLGCNSCHDLSLAHTDGAARTFGCEDGCDSTEYRNGYRLRQISGQAPMQIPLTGGVNDSSQFRLCYSCHDSGPFLDADNPNTNLISTGTDGTKNRHQYHLNFAFQLRYPADYNYGGTVNSRITCVTCHNVHGTTRLAMVNDGKLINREPGLRIWYNNPAQVTYNSSSPNPPIPEDVTLTASTGTLISYGSSTNLCGHCHGNNNVTAENRTPFQNMAVISTDPAVGTGEVPLNSAVTINWDKALDCSTITTSTITISPAVGWTKTSCAGSQAVFTPNSQSGSTLYTVTVSPSVKNTDGGGMAESYPFSYTTVAPTVAAPTMAPAAVLSTTSIQWSFTDNADNEEGFKIHDADHDVKASEATVNLSSLTETGLAANTRYTRHAHAYRTGEDSLPSANASAYTWPVVPQVTADKTTSIWSLTSDVVFTNAVGFGDGAVQYYRYAWNTSASHAFTDTETQWTSGTLTKTATSEGSWYLHVKSYNGDNVANTSTVDYGPYNYDGIVLAVNSTSPANGATNGVVDGNVTINFNENVDCATVTTSTVTIDPAVGWTRTSCGGSQAVFAPNGQSASTEYTVTVSTSVKDANTLPLSPSAQFSYTTVAAGGVITVCKAGAPSCNFATIQGAISDAGTTDGKVVLVTDSATYSEKINFNGKPITVQSANGAANTKIDGDGTNSPVVTFSSGETAGAVLDGFTIDNKAATSQSATRGIYIAGSSSPTIKNSIIEGNSVTNCSEDGTACGGGGVYIKNSAPIFDTCTIRNNSITNRYGGGAYVTGDASAPTFTDTTISSNTSNQHAGGIYSNAAPLTLTNCTISGNATGSTASFDGGGLFLNGATASATISGGTFSGNSGRAGGAIYITGSTAAIPLSISNATISSNTSYVGAGIYLTGVTNPSTLTNTTISSNTATQFGGGINSNSPLTISASHIDNNTVTSTSHDGGGIYLALATATATITNTSVNGNTARGGAGMFITSDADATVTGGTVSGNICYSGSGGGGISIANAGSSLTIAQAVISGNRGGTYGGGIMNGATATISNCTITGNTTYQQIYSDGGGVYSSGTLSVYNSTIAGNYAKRYGGGLRVQSGTASVYNSILSGNTAGTSGPQISGAPTVSYSDIEGTFAGTGNIASDPLFASFTVPDDKAGDNDPKTGGDYHLQSGSPCKNTGNNAEAPAGTDIDGDNRIIGGTVDMGSDEAP